MFIKGLKLIAIALFFTSIAAAQSTGASKIGLVNSYAFGDEKAGITKFITATSSLNREFAPLQVELNTMNTRLGTLSKEIEGLRNVQAANPTSIQAKYDEAEKLQRDIRVKTEDAKLRYEKRQQQVLGPVQEAIGNGLQEYAKQKGYSLIFDASKDQNGFLIAVGDQSVDVTKDFITYYNAKP